MGFIGYVDIIICHSYLQLLCIVGFVGIAGIMWHPLSNTRSSTFILLELPTATWSQATSWWTRRVTELDCTEKPRINWGWLWAIWFYLTCATQYFCSYLQLEYVSSIGIYLGVSQYNQCICLNQTCWSGLYLANRRLWSGSRPFQCWGRDWDWLGRGTVLMVFTWAMKNSLVGWVI